jgi:hypothetical protein
MQSELSSLSSRIAAVCHERTDVQRYLFEYRHTRRDLQQWEKRLAELNGERDALIERQRQVFKKWKAK